MKRLDGTRHLRHHAFVIEAEAEEGIAEARAWVQEELGMELKSNPDVAVLRYGLFSIDDARGVYNSAIQAPFRGEHKVLIIAANRVYHEAQNALLKLFEEPPKGTCLFLILPSLGGLLPTLRSRVSVLAPEAKEKRKAGIPKAAEEFIRGNKAKRSALIKRLTSGKDEKERRAYREEAIAIVNGIEAAAYEKGLTASEYRELLKEIQLLRGYLHDRSAPLRMILEHLSLVIPKNLL